MNAEDVLINMQQDFLLKLKSETYCAGFGVESLRRMVISKEMNKALITVASSNGKVGLWVIVGMPYVDGIDPNVAGPQADVFIPIDIIEIPELNFGDIGTTVTCESAGMKLASMLCAWQVAGLAFFYGDKSLLTSLEDEYGKGTNTYRLIIAARLSQDSPAKCVVPSIAENALAVTLTNNTAGATIYYTTNETFPGSGNADAHVYTVPFLVTSGTVVRYAAYKSDKIGSDVGKAIIS